MTGRSVARVERARRDAAILESLAQGSTQRQAADEHGVSKTTVTRVLENMRRDLPGQDVARDTMLARFTTYRDRLWPLLDDDPVRGVKSLLAVDEQESRVRGLYDPQTGNGTAAVTGMLAMLIGRTEGGAP